jgi:mannose-6-phosphate isomerase-like protein (cupin superfamily)
MGGVIASAADRERERFGDPARGDVSWFTLFSGELTPTSAMCAGLAEFAPHGGTLAPHRHSQAEIYFVAEGRGRLTIDGVETAISAGMSVFIPGDAEHSVRNDSAAVLKIFYVFPTANFSDVVYRFTDHT